MTRPGVVVTSRADVPPRSAPTDAGMAFLVGATESGEAVKRVVSMTQYEAEFGQRTGFTDAYDAAETFYREGGSALTVARTNEGGTADLPGALAALTKSYGPGQIFVPGAAGILSTTHDALIAARGRQQPDCATGRRPGLHGHGVVRACHHVGG
jgi:hypothetical protein